MNCELVVKPQNTNSDDPVETPTPTLEPELDLSVNDLYDFWDALD